MYRYLVTTELYTPWWLKLLRFCRIKSKRQEFELVFEIPWFDIGTILLTSSGKVLVIKEIKHERHEDSKL